MMGEPMTEEIVLIEECAKYFKTSVSTIIDLSREAKILTKVGSMWRFLFFS